MVPLATPITTIGKSDKILWMSILTVDIAKQNESIINAIIKSAASLL
jgi:hypothetical protein